MDFKVGDHVSALRSHNKAVRLTGTIEAIGERGNILMRLDDNPEWLETVHEDDVTVLPPDSLPYGHLVVEPEN